MPTPLAPIVHGPILATSPFVAVFGVLDGAQVDLLLDGAVVVTDRAAANGAMALRPPPGTLKVGQAVTARQSLGGEVGPESSLGVSVTDPPTQIPNPVFLSPLSIQMNRVLLGGLVPGAEVTLVGNGTPLSTFFPSSVVDEAPLLNPNLLAIGMVIEANQTLGGVSCPKPTRSLPLGNPIAADPLRPPNIIKPVTACSTSITATGLVPSGELEISTGGDTWTALILGPTYGISGLPPLKEGPLTAMQRLPRSNTKSAVDTIQVGPAVKPPEPKVFPFCPETRRVLVSQLVPGGVLTLTAMEFFQGSGPKPPEVEIGSVGIAGSSQEIDLPRVIGGGQTPTQIIARQTSCGLTSEASNAFEFAREGALPLPQPEIAGDLFDCMRQVPARGLGMVLTRVISVQDEANPRGLGDWVVPNAPDALIPTWFPLTAGDAIRIEQKGCGAPPQSETKRVTPLPNPLPSPTIPRGVRPGAVAVTAAGYIPGARLDLLVTGRPTAMIASAWGREATFVFAQPLAEDQRLTVVQSICGEQSTRDVVQQVVKKGKLKATPAPDTADGGKAAMFTVTAVDTDTGLPVPGLEVLMAGATIGVTGKPFSWTPPTNLDLFTGQVRGNDAYENANFNIKLEQSVDLHATLAETGIDPNVAVLENLVWTVQPNWPGAAPLTSNVKDATFTVPPPKGPNPTVDVLLSFKIRVKGVVNGIPWDDSVPIDGRLATVALTKPKHGVGAIVQLTTTEVPIIGADKKTIIGYETKLFGFVTLTSVF